MTWSIPLQQGNLDGLCGVYSIINATGKIIGQLDENEQKEMFRKIISYLYKKYSNNLDFLFNDGGITIRDIGSVLKDVIEPRHGIIRKKPHHKSSSLELNNFWDSMTKFLGEPQRAIILGLARKHDHWTVVDSITEKRLTLLDSGGLCHINRRVCTTVDSDPTSIHLLKPTHTYFLERKL